MGRGRAFRRHHAKRAKTKARKFLGKVWLTAASTKGSGPNQSNNVVGLGRWYNPTNKQIGRFASTHCCPCTCMMCSRTRRFHGKSLQERRADQRCRY